MMLNANANNPVIAAGYLLKGVAMLTHPALRIFLLIPVLLNLLLYGTALALAFHYIDALIAHFIPDWLQWLDWILWPLFFICFFIVGFFTFTLLANLIAAPFYGKLAAKTLALIDPAAPTVAEPPLAHVIAAELKRASYIFFRALPLLLLFVIPGVNLIAPLLWVLFGAWGMALEYFAYPLENAGVLFPEQRRWAQQNRWAALSFGGMTMLGLTLPMINIVVAPAAVIGATLYLNDSKQ